MGNTQSQIDARHIGIYKKVLAIQNSQTRLQMIDTLMGDPSMVHSAKLGGVYAGVLQYSAAIRHGGTPPPLPGELSFSTNSTGHVLAPPQIQQRVPSNQQIPNQLQHFPQALQLSPAQVQRQQYSQQQGSHQLIQTETQRYHDPYQQVSKPQRSQKALNFFSACLRVLNIQEEVALTEEALKAAYKKAVIKAHPDKPGGSKEAFDAVTRAYAYLIDILKLVQGRTTKTTEAVPEIGSVQEQRKSAAQDWQMPAEPVKLNPNNLNMAVFNQMFEQTRIPDPDEDGYGDWLKNESGGPMKKGSKKFSEDFNREVFNRMFEEEAHTQGKGNTSITAYQTQELILSPTSGVELGRDRPADYTAPINSDLQFTDLRAAYTKENTVSNQIQGVRVENRDFQKYKAQRERAPDAYNPAELAGLHAYEAQQKAKEEQRRLRAAQEHVSARDYFERMKQLVITEK